MIEAIIFHGMRALGVVVIIGGVIGLIGVVSMDYWDTREYRKNFKRNLREYEETN